jgi:hypothetical protein
LTSVDGGKNSGGGKLSLLCDLIARKRATPLCWDANTSARFFAKLSTKQKSRDRAARAQTTGGCEMESRTLQCRRKEMSLPWRAIVAVVLLFIRCFH